MELDVDPNTVSVNTQGDGCRCLFVASLEEQFSLPTWKV